MFGISYIKYELENVRRMTDEMVRLTDIRVRIMEEQFKWRNEFFEKLLAPDSDERT